MLKGLTHAYILRSLLKDEGFINQGITSDISDGIKRMAPGGATAETRDVVWRNDLLEKSLQLSKMNNFAENFADTLLKDALPGKYNLQWSISLYCWCLVSCGVVH